MNGSWLLRPACEEEASLEREEAFDLLVPGVSPSPPLTDTIVPLSSSSFVVARSSASLAFSSSATTPCRQKDRHARRAAGCAVLSRRRGGEGQSSVLLVPKEAHTRLSWPLQTQTPVWASSAAFKDLIVVTAHGAAPLKEPLQPRDANDGAARTARHLDLLLDRFGFLLHRVEFLLDTIKLDIVRGATDGARVAVHRGALEPRSSAGRDYATPPPTTTTTTTSTTSDHAWAEEDRRERRVWRAARF